MNRYEMLERLENGEDALDLSIEKWKDIVSCKGIDQESFNCALCETYSGEEDEEEEACKGCPVRNYTGVEGCEDSPWVRYNEMSLRHGNYSKYALRWAKKELEFLKELKKIRGD